MDDPQPQQELSDDELFDLERAKSWATTSLVLGIVGLVPGLALLLTPVAGGIGLWQGYKARRIFRQFRLHAYAYGKSRSTAGIVLCWIQFGVLALFVVMQLVPRVVNAVST